MEISSDNILRTESKAKAGKPPTRLQAQAPASLRLDQMTFSAPAPANVLPAGDTSRAIPLLSPLVLSPQLLQDSTEKLTCGHDQSNEHQEEGTADKTNNGGSGESGWQHQEAATFADPSSLFSFFQSQCMIVNPAQ
ncbi:hypothetical protein L484_025298 [Morus notabilis]|uniref:Uncharacterized protein n=1 Tax=Morus notabilis TaxID=981085 RepID=W9RU96_9ROSA|nr:uncharacterized protein LOC21408002 [Morus notabilis]EXC10714.1 hypothetical protein L484_025298 [Morus notabilis]